MDRLHPLHQQSMQYHSVRNQPRTTEKNTFKEVLAQTEDLQFSKHAQTRMKQRGIALSLEQVNLLNEKMVEAKSKGVTESLVLTKDAALIVNTHKRTVITAMSRGEADAHIFTNINGTILLNK
ncbi:TIGR02530 family flagellar biosynthesis protein [Pontibacillus halophilus]|uniref:TIGR02530 family flagellar biosynthesis protein n=1 Tax=Pontibacillus halophilus TaxID=516704 RepID=UPI001E3F4019|nr:TIGR02530 family flagellar biosynthesis protein [Pontibacillus halophilus]